MNSEGVSKVADLIADNVQLTQICEMLDKENKRLKHNMQMVSRNSYMKGWNEATKKMRNFITKHMLDYWKEEYENHN